MSELPPRNEAVPASAANPLRSSFLPSSSAVLSACGRLGRVQFPNRKHLSPFRRPEMGRTHRRGRREAMECVWRAALRELLLSHSACCEAHQLLAVGVRFRRASRHVPCRVAGGRQAGLERNRGGRTAAGAVYADDMFLCPVGPLMEEARRMRGRMDLR